MDDQQPPTPPDSPTLATSRGKAVAKPGMLVGLGIALALAIVAAVVLAVALQKARADLADARDEVERLEVAEADRLEEANTRPDVGAVVETWLGEDDSATVSGDDESASVRIRSPDAGTEEALTRLLDDLGFSTAVRERMARTRALDGTQQADGRNVNVTWTYHPDDGLQMVFEAEQ